MTNTNVVGGRRGDFSHLKQVSFPSGDVVLYFTFKLYSCRKPQLKVLKCWYNHMNVMLSEKYKCDVGEGDFSHLKLESRPLEGSGL